MSRSVLYARISRDASGRARGVERQIEDGLEVFRRKNWPPPAPEDVFVDNDKSASKFGDPDLRKRTAYKRLLGLIEAGACDSGRIVMAVEDRTHRQVVELAEFIDLARTHNITVATEGTEYDLSDPDQMTMWFIKVRFAEAEVEKISKRVKRARLQEAAHGKRHAGGSREFGDRGRRRVQNPDGTWRTEPIVSEAQAAREREIIAEIGMRILAGDSLRGIRLDLTRRGIQTATGKVFTNQTLRKLMLSPRLAGYRTHNGTLHPSDDYPAILDPGTWEAVCAVLRDKARITNHRGGLPRHLLSGMLFCGICGHPMHPRPRGDGFIYRCPPPDGSGRCGKVSRDAAKVERLIEAALFKAVESPQWEERAASRPAEDPTRLHYARLAELTAELDVLDRRIGEAELAEELGRRPHPSAATLRRMLAEREAEQERHQAAVTRLQTGRTVAAIPRNLRQLWPDFSLDRKRAILKALLRLPPEGKGIVIQPQRPLGPGGFDPAAIEPDWRA